MRILVVAGRHPFPPRRGDELRAIQCATALASRHQVTLLVPESPFSGTIPIDLPFRVETFSRRRRVLPVAMLAALGDGLPIQNAFFAYPALPRRLEELRSSTDLVVLQLVRLAGALPPTDGPPMIVDFIDSLALNFQTRARRDRHLAAAVPRARSLARGAGRGEAARSRARRRSWCRIAIGSTSNDESIRRFTAACAPSRSRSTATAGANGRLWPADCVAARPNAGPTRSSSRATSATSSIATDCSGFCPRSGPGSAASGLSCGWSPPARARRPRCAARSRGRARSTSTIHRTSARWWPAPPSPSHRSCAAPACRSRCSRRGRRGRRWWRRPGAPPASTARARSRWPTRPSSGSRPSVVCSTRRNAERARLRRPRQAVEALLAGGGPRRVPGKRRNGGRERRRLARDRLRVGPVGGFLRAKFS